MKSPLGSSPRNFQILASLTRRMTRLLRIEPAWLRASTWGGGVGGSRHHASAGCLIPSGPAPPFPQGPSLGQNSRERTGVPVEGAVETQRSSRVVHRKQIHQSRFPGGNHCNILEYHVTIYFNPCFDALNNIPHD